MAALRISDGVMVAHEMLRDFLKARNFYLWDIFPI
jgi:hypothetical protein